MRSHAKTLESIGKLCQVRPSLRRRHLPYHFFPPSGRTASFGLPNAFIQALMPEVKDGDERVMMKITGVLVDMLVELNPELYGLTWSRKRTDETKYFMYK
jgi:hypothetical protein